MTDYVSERTEGLVFAASGVTALDTVTSEFQLTGWKDDVPQPDYVFVDVPGRNGAINLSRAVSGSVRFTQGKATFTLVKQYTTQALAISGLATTRTALDGKQLDVSLKTFNPSSNTWTSTALYSSVEVAVTEYEISGNALTISVECIYG